MRPSLSGLRRAGITAVIVGVFAAACGDDSVTDPTVTYAITNTTWMGEVTLPLKTVKVRPGTTTFTCTWEFTFEPVSVSIEYGSATTSAEVPVDAAVSYDYAFPEGIPENGGGTTCAAGTRSVSGEIVGTAGVDGELNLEGEIGAWDVSITADPASNGTYTCNSGVLTSPATITLQYAPSNIEGLEDWETLTPPLEASFTATHTMPSASCDVRPTAS